MAAQQPMDEAARDVMLAEYKSLRDEILKKMDHRTTYRLATLTLSVGATGVGIQLKSPLLLLLVPIITLLLGNLTAFQTIQVSRLSTYVREHIERPLRNDFPDAMGWHHSNANRQMRLRESLAVSYIPNAAIPIVPSLVALGLAWTYDGALLGKIFLTCVDVGLLTYFLSLYIQRRLDL